jgi:hypothetical protein
MGLGPYPEVGLAEARSEGARMRGLIRGPDVTRFPNGKRPAPPLQRPNGKARRSRKFWTNTPPKS